MVPALLLAAAVSASCAWKNPHISGSMSVIVRYPFKIPFKFDFSGSFAAGRIVCGKREHYLNVTKNIAKQTAFVRLCPFVRYSVMLTLSVAAVATVHKNLSATVLLLILYTVSAVLSTPFA